jgi:hypothetical protein
MRRSDLEHIIRAAGEIAGVKEIIILGSQSILGQFPSLGEENFNNGNNVKIGFTPVEFNPCKSAEADIMVPENEELADEIEGAIGEFSLFHETHGYYAQAVDSTTSKLPRKWKERLVTISNERTNGVKGLCLEVHDLIISKLFASREKDIEFFKSLIALKLIEKKILIERLDESPFERFDHNRISNLINRYFYE